MKTLRFLLLPLFASAPLSAQWVVSAPDVTTSVNVMNAKQLAQWAEAIKRYEDQIIHQIEQIQKAQQLLDIQNTIGARIGDWQGVYDRAKSIKLNAENLNKDYGANYKNVAFVDYGQPSLSYTGRGNFEAVAATSRSGHAAPVAEVGLRRYRAVENLFDDLNTTFDQTEKDRREILDEISKTADDIAKAKTQAETDKLFAKLEALKAALANVQAQRDEKMQRMMVQHTINQNQQEKEEEVAAAVSEQNARDELRNLSNTSIGGSTFR